MAVASSWGHHEHSVRLDGRGPNYDYDGGMGNTFTAGGDVSAVAGAGYDSRGNLRNGLVALLLSGDSGGGDRVRGGGDGVRGDGDGVRGDVRDVQGFTSGDVEQSWRQLSEDARNPDDAEHEVLVDQGYGEQGDDEHDEAEQGDEGHADDHSTTDGGGGSLEVEEQIVEAAEKILRQTPRNSIDTWVLYRRLLRYRHLKMLSRAVACALAMQMRDHEKETLREQVPDIRFNINRCRRRTVSTAFGSARCT
ncbi:hypothetical protein PHYSODRAFT_306678 [Phytophthora sojae]|uniref:Uncharacterized protein n=1 Tax=Phytophthora sojae (strain P6497) TaxID=1094619 RepID=G5AAA7_PHYSP|nr:hypothetical protein PHYSODRAFT_306678 [Phytophthora sojae]EGZ07536.1 hypothetical protein PHYSODRAFT_306678 [Phytophthora sojae]|eukprot:XP_009537102.1 hypothetical protein PHYSODRAFT_306678 [Phytophthora sojae]